jgi:lysophospholipase L1-like esterase
MKTKNYERRQFINHLLGGTFTLAVTPNLLAQNLTYLNDEIDWYDVKDFDVEGKGWKNTKKFFDRLPAKAEGFVRDQVWGLSRDSAGMSIRFISDSPNIYVRYELSRESLSMTHMAATGHSGVDLYAQDGMGIDRWVAVVRPGKQKMDTTIAKGLAPGSRRYTLYLPLRNGIESLEIGVVKGEAFEALPPRSERPIVFYGTSIMHGACASRPGMAFPSILGRRLRRPIINLGFAGNGRMEIEVGSLLAELDPCVFVIDCLPNMNESTVSQRTIPLVKKIRETHDKTPILLVEDRSFTSTRFFPARKKRHQKNRIALKKAFNELERLGVKNIFYLDGDNLLGQDGEAATDGSHPSDLGMTRYADAYEPVLRRILKQY